MNFIINNIKFTFLTTTSPPALLMFLILFFISIIPNHSYLVQCLHKERIALLQFKAQFIDDVNRLTTWGNNGEIVGQDDCCRWEGVTCDNTTNHVISLDLNHRYLRGKIINESSLVELNHLQYLDLSTNTFEGSQIFESIYSLTNLKHLNLNRSNFSGLIPNLLSNLSMLKYVDLSDNHALIVNELDWLGGLRSLEYLDLSGVNLERVSSTWVQTISNLRMLKELHLLLCNLSETNTTLSSSINVSSTSDLAILNLSGNDLVQFDDLMMLLSNFTKLEYLDLSYNKLGGTFPNMSRFSFLKELVLKENDLNGSLIEGNIRLPRLEVLDVSWNQFTGSVPNLTSSSSSLRELYLSNNMFNGTLTGSIGHLSKLENLDLGSNQLQGIISESHLLNLSSLKRLMLSNNSNPSIKINTSWKPPFQLVRLDLSNCNLGPDFPKWLQTQQELTHLYISNAKIQDTVPDWFWDNSQMLRELVMSNNEIHGFVPNLSSLMPNMFIIDLSSNQFNGPLPLLPTRSVFSIDVSNNSFSGTIVQFCNGSRDLLSYLDLSNNLLFGEFHKNCSLNTSPLTFLSLANNNFSGPIPNLSSDFSELLSLSLRNNSFEGQIPKSLKSCTQIQVLDLGENKLTGKIPSWIGERMRRLAVLSLRSNMLFGSMPLSLCRLTNLQVLDMSMNKISGTIPKCINNFSSMISTKLQNQITGFAYVESGTYQSAMFTWKGKEAIYDKYLELVRLIDLSSNNLFGEIPPEITRLAGLMALNLSRNNLIGPIPFAIGKLESLDFLDLSENNLSGRIPATLSQLSLLGVLNLSFNNFSGRIPWESHLTTFGDDAFMGNPGLCGVPLRSKPCPEDSIHTEPIVNDADGDENSYSSYMSDGLYICMAIGFITSFCVVVGTIFHNKMCRVTFLKMIKFEEDWLYVKILVHKNRLKRQFVK